MLVEFASTVELDTVFRGTYCLDPGLTCYYVRGLIYGQSGTFVFTTDAGVGRPWTCIRGVAIEIFRNTASTASGGRSALEN